jgi:hypothetical protein
VTVPSIKFVFGADVLPTLTDIPATNVLPVSIVSDRDPVPIVRDVVEVPVIPVPAIVVIAAELLADKALAAALKALSFTSVAVALASVANVGKAARNESARDAKLAESARLGGVGSGVIGIRKAPLFQV